MNESEFRALYRELIEENPLAVRAVLKILEIEFTPEVDTLAVTCEEKPRLKVNLDFLGENCRRESHVKAVICHEFLHVLLRHTERFENLTPALHIALDAVINAILHRELGPDYSGMMSEFYANAKGAYRLLRPIEEEEKRTPQQRRDHLNGVAESPAESAFLHLWEQLYLGKLAADDIHEVVRDLGELGALEPGQLLGGHRGAGSFSEEAPVELPPRLAEAVNRSMRQMNGSGIWRSPRGCGLGARGYKSVIQVADAGVERWKRETYVVLKRLLRPDPQSDRARTTEIESRLPVLSASDRRAALRALWSPFIPEASWTSLVSRPAGSAHVYLDVSGSMCAEIPLVVALLHRLRGQVRRPLWAFSDQVVPAQIQKGKLLAETTGGTSMACVLEHVAAKRPRTALVVTDGHIEEVEKSLLRRTAATKLHALVTRDGDPYAFHQAGIPYTQLGRLPQ